MKKLYIILCALGIYSFSYGLDFSRKPTAEDFRKMRYKVHVALQSLYCWNREGRWHVLYDPIHLEAVTEVNADFMRNWIEKEIDPFFGHLAVKREYLVGGSEREAFVSDVKNAALLVAYMERLPDRLKIAAPTLKSYDPEGFAWQDKFLSENDARVPERQFNLDVSTMTRARYLFLDGSIEEARFSVSQKEFETYLENHSLQ